MKSKEKQKIFPSCPDNKIRPQDKFTNHMKDKNQKLIQKQKKLLSDWTDKKKYLIYYGILNFMLDMVW